MLKTLRKKFAALLIGLLITATMLTFSWNRTFTASKILPHLDNFLYDANLKLFKKKFKNPQVVIVDIDETSLAAEGKWPWSRNKTATLVKRLHDDGAAVIAFDIMFPEKDLNPAKILVNYTKQQQNVPESVTQYLTAQQDNLDNDKIFAQQLMRGDNILGVFFHNELYNSVGHLGKPFLQLPTSSTLVVPKLKRYTGVIEPLIKAAPRTGFVTVIPDSDGVLRRIPLFIRYKNYLYPALSLEAAKVYLLQDKVSLDVKEIDGKQVLLGARLGKTYIPTDASGSMLIPFKGPARTFPYVSATKVLHNEIPPNFFSGKIVFIGSSSVGIGDMHNTPLQSAAYPGVEIHANVTNAILNEDFILSPVWATGLERILIVLLGIILSFALLYCSASILFLTVIGTELGVFGLLSFAWIKWSLILPYPILLYLLALLLGLFNLAYSYLFEIRFKNKLRGIYGQYVSNKHIDAMLDNPNRYTQNGETKEMSVLFTDIRGFTSISEKLDATQVKSFLNQLFTPLTEIIFNHKGTIDKYVGDMIMAFWNDPIADPEHHQHAVIAGLKMLDKIQEMAPTFAEQNLPDVRMGIGVNSGVMHVGDMGSKFRRSYTVLGDTVNLASRLESSTKFYGVKMLISETTKQHCNNITIRFVDKVKVKGKKEAINIFEPICPIEQASPELLEEIKLHTTATKAYFAQNWDEAKKIFTELKQKNPEFLLYQVFLERIENFIAEPPPQDWDGSFERKQK